MRTGSVPPAGTEYDAIPRSYAGLGILRVIKLDLAALICYTFSKQFEDSISLFCAETARKRIDLYDTLKTAGRFLQWNGLIA